MVGREQVTHIAIAEQDARDEGLDLGRQVLSQLIVERRKQIRIRHDRIEVVEVQPLEREVPDQARRAAVAQHPQRFGLKHLLIAQLAGSGNLQQRLVRTLAPEEERKARCQLQIAQWKFARRGGRIAGRGGRL